ncbi:MAG: CPBP family intramembrane metalloprotease [Chloroflexota bacterium]|nr:MAG: CPBP family intramembrane metalloprotease [Chloroflexota bacterium]
MGQLFLNLTEQGKNGAARWLGGTLNVLFFWFIIGSILSAPFLIISVWGLLTSGEFNGQLDRADPFWLYLATNVSFLGVWLGLWLTVRFIHQRAFRTLVTPAPKISWRRIAQGFFVWLALIALAQVVEFVIYPERAQFTFDPSKWILFLPFVLILTPIQTSAEELLFRGYWLQGTGRLTRNVIVLCVINGILFGLPHMLNPEVMANPNDTLVLFLNYFVTGAALALYTLRDNRLELALGAHASNNLFAALAVNYKDSALTTPALFTNSTLDAYFGFVMLMLVSVAFYLIVFRVLDRRADKSLNELY